MDCRLLSFNQSCGFRSFGATNIAQYRMSSYSPRLFLSSANCSMKSYKLSDLTRTKVDGLKARQRNDFSSIFGVVQPIVDDIQNRGDAAVEDYTMGFDKVEPDTVVENVNDLPDPVDVEENICKFANKGTTPSQIDVVPGDSRGIARVKRVINKNILMLLKPHGLTPGMPEDLYHLIKKAVAIGKHWLRTRKDNDSVFGLNLVESRIGRLARYYKKTKKLRPVWEYESIAISIHRRRKKK